MKGTLTEKILKKHLVSGKLVPGQEISVKIDQTLTQDATGTMAYLEFLNFGLEKISTKLSVSYVDHNTLQTGFENADDHLFLQSVAEKFGIYFSKPGNGICHQVHSERFAKPGDTLIGSDSHTPTAGGVGMIAIGVGGLEVASAMAGYPYSLTCPEVVGIKLKGKLQPWVSAKDIILTVLKKFTVKGGVNRVFEYFGDGVKSPDGAGARNHYEHGRRARRHDVNIPFGHKYAEIPEVLRQGKGLQSLCGRQKSAVQGNL